MATSVSDIAADAVVRTEFPPDSVGRNVGRDIGYIFRLLAFHLKRDPLVGTLLWILAVGASILASVLSLHVALNMAATTNGLVARDHQAVVSAIAGTTLFATLTCVNIAFKLAVEMTLRIRIRTALTADLLSRWLGGRNFYRPVPDAGVDFPEQRIQEDAYNFGWYAVDLLQVILGTIASFSIYSQQLWNLAAPLPISLPIAGEIIVPKALYLAAIVSAVGVTVITHLVGKVLTRLDVVRQRIEAGFRHDLGQAREYAEQIVLSNGQPIEKARGEHDYRLIRKNWRPYTIFSSILQGVQVSPTVALILPYWFLFNAVLAGKMNVGDLVVATAAFGAVYNALATASSHYTTFALLRSAALRLNLMDKSLSVEPAGGFTRVAADHAAFELRELEVKSVNGRTLFALGNLRIGSGERWLVRGRSGSGKSTLFRVLAGIWPFGSGTIEPPDNRASIMFLPQKPYLPNGSLAELLSYPRSPDTYRPEDYRRALRDVCLDQLADRVNDVQAWSKILSGGEQQRIYLARALLQRPDFLFLDEATSSLDPETEATVFNAITEQLPTSAIVTIAHSDRLAGHHGHVLKIDDERATIIDLGAPRPKQVPKRKDGRAGEVDA